MTLLDSSPKLTTRTLSSVLRATFWLSILPSIIGCRNLRCNPLLVVFDGIDFVAKKQTGWPFQEGFVDDGTQEVHVFTDYRWNNGSVSRRWHVDPENYDPTATIVRLFLLKLDDIAD